MKVAVIRFPGSNCDQDAYFALRTQLGLQAEYVWHEETSLKGFEGVIVPGGFSYGDYLRCGAMASRSNIMTEVVKAANNGVPVLGVCNGFQILCEAGLLPGALVRNIDQKFLCQTVYLRAANKSSIWTSGVTQDLAIPIAHGEGRYIAAPEVIQELQQSDRIAFHYVNGDDLPDGNPNPNGSMHSIAGILNKQGNVMGMMPHPERASANYLGSADGLQILKAFQAIAV